MGCMNAKEEADPTCPLCQQTLCWCPPPGVVEIKVRGCVYPTNTLLWCSCRDFRLTVYPKSNLLAINGMLWRFCFGCRRLGNRALERAAVIDLTLQPCLGRVEALLSIYSARSSTHFIRPVGLRAVRAVQRRVKEKGRRLAVAMALHERLGAQSALQELGEDLVRVVCK